jgi:hypothetical protein
MKRRASRRQVFSPHAYDPGRLNQCPICQWLIDQDHAEALSMNPEHREPTQGLVQPTPPQFEYVPLEVAGFTLV